MRHSTLLPVRKRRSSPGCSGRTPRLTTLLLFLATLTLTPALALSAQIIRGVVTDSATNEPIPAVMITLQDSMQQSLAQVRTTATGSFQVDAQRAGTVRFVIRKVGAQPSYSGYYAIPPNVDTLQVDLSTPVRGVTIATVTIVADREVANVNEQQLEYAKLAGWQIIEPWRIAKEREVASTFEELMRRLPLGGVRVPHYLGQDCYTSKRKLSARPNTECLVFVVDGQVLAPDTYINPMDVHFAAYVPAIKSRALYGVRAWHGAIFVATRRHGDVETRP